MIQIMVAVALALWGSVSVFLSTPIIYVERTNGASDEWYAYTGTTDLNRDCTITLVSRNFDPLSPADQQTIITHEVGHCIEMGHITAAGIMNAYPLSSGGVLTAADIAECQRVHPTRPDLPYRAFASVIHN